MLQASEARRHEPYLLVGDWNTGAHRIDEKGKTYVCAEHFLKLTALGWTDVQAPADGPASRQRIWVGEAQCVSLALMVP